MEDWVWGAEDESESQYEVEAGHEVSILLSQCLHAVCTPVCNHLDWKFYPPVSKPGPSSPTGGPSKFSFLVLP